MKHCANRDCRWNDGQRATGCRLFSGKSWSDCKTKVIRMIEDKNDKERSNEIPQNNDR